MAFQFGDPQIQIRFEVESKWQFKYKWHQMLLFLHHAFGLTDSKRLKN